ncbi:unnamed protein product [Lathyrus sativus]|nr:unnamed protein product [Lathyrus sativus]
MDLANDGDDGGDGRKSFDSVSCSICLEIVSDHGDRSSAKLQCGHQFHLDCIGSAFNVKGAMQCPNCRKIEKGQWLYGSSSRLYPEFNMDDWTRDEDAYDISFSEMSMGVHWCPFGNFTQLPSSYEEREFASNAYHDALGTHAMFSEHSAVSSGNHPCPYIAYVGPIHPSTSNSGGTVSEVSNFNHWSGPPTHGDMSASYTIPAVVFHYHSWDHHSSHFSSGSSHLGAADQPSVSQSNQRPARGGSEVPRSGSYMHPFPVGHSSIARAGNSAASSMIPPYPGSSARARDRVQALQAYYQQQQPPNSTTVRAPVASSTRRSNGHSGSALLASLASAPDQSGSYVYVPGGRNFHEETRLPNQLHAWERDHLPSSSLNQVGRESSWRAYHQSAGRSDPGFISSSYRLRSDSDRTPSQNR